MASTSNVHLHLYTYGDIVVDEIINCYPNVASPVQAKTILLSPGDNIIEQPELQLPTSLYKITGLLIKPPSNNVISLALAGVMFDPGLGVDVLTTIVNLHPSNPTFLSLDPTGVTAYHLVLGGIPGGPQLTINIFWV